MSDIKKLKDKFTVILFYQPNETPKKDNYFIYALYKNNKLEVWFPFDGDTYDINSVLWGYFLALGIHWGSNYKKIPIFWSNLSETWSLSPAENIADIEKTNLKKHRW